MIKTIFNKRKSTWLYHFCILVLALLMMFPSVAMAADVQLEVSENAQIIPKNIPFEGPKFLDDLGSVSTKEAIVFNNNEYRLYCTFDDPEAAVENVYRELESFINLLKVKYSLPDLSVATAEMYYYASVRLLDDSLRPEWYTECSEEYIKMDIFYDIFENEKANNTIRSTLASNKRTPANASTSIDVMDLDVALLLPYDEYTAYLEDNSLTLNDVQEHVGINALGFDIATGILYATARATSPNYVEYGYLSLKGDCTNFVSQILAKGGVAQVVYPSVLSGWWHTTFENKHGVTNHKYSNSWVGADTFARYMGIGYTSRSNYLFSENISAGDFIATDSDDDGDWGHMGFVTGKRRYDASLGYTDYEVAQHSSNYHKWASEEGNGWSKVGLNGGRYARVRR